ncbi:hypothetical protein L2725_05350 [Shewanella corallii]|uniref:Esterase n=1 Tax=Shewanella corallii TaxID=560080 RepID=A0ABT0N551_9GAMM|nr:alpha/beta hydrolase-fold protein [Shewanella corallii]MCL2913210.1 hypothetical protein [Shewanella corallii]
MDIESNALGHSLKVEVFTPDSYDTATDQVYPVLYVLDGAQHGEHTAINAKFLESTDVMPEILVVAIPGVDRFKFFTPTRDKQSSRVSGQADTYLSFLKQELMPAINQGFRTSGYDMLAGHSLGGLFGAYVLKQNPELFDAYHLFSPSLWWDEQVLVNSISATDSSHKPYIFLSLANEQGRQKQAYDAYLEKLMAVYPDIETYDLPDEDHMTTPLLSQILAFRSQFNDWLLEFDEVVANPGVFKSHFKQLNARYGTRVKGAEWQIGQPIQQIIDVKKDPAKALAGARVYLEIYPRSPWANKAMADALALTGDKEQALGYMRKAVALAKQNNSQYLEVFEAGLEKL